MKKLNIKDINEESIVKTVRAKVSLWKRVEDTAAKNNISVNKLVVTLINFGLDNLEENENENQSD